MRPLRSSLHSFFANRRRPLWPTLLAWALCTALWGAWLLRAEMQTTREDFETQSRILHRLLTQRAEQHEALFAALSALEPSLPQMSAEVANRTLTSFIASVIASYPQVTGVRRYQLNAADRMPDELSAALKIAARDGQAVLPDTEGFILLRRGAAQSRSVWRLDVRTDRLLDADEQPPPGIFLRLQQDAGPVLWQRVATQQAWPGLAPLHFEKHLGVRTQPYLMTTTQTPLPVHLPWASFAMGAGILLALCASAGWAIGEYRQRVLTQRQLALAHASRVNAMGEVAAGMAHELNQPLAAILSSVQAAVRWLDDQPPEVDSAREATAAAARQARRAGEILQRLRNFISPQAGVKESVDLNEVVASAQSLVAESLHARNVSFSSRLDDALPAVTGERVAFEQVVVNLLLNAADAMHAANSPQRRILVETSQRDGRVLLAVSDSGPGLSEEVKSRLFEPFFTTKSNGMGLGLSICEHIVQQAGGELAADNAKEGGAVFVMSVPAVTRSVSS